MHLAVTGFIGHFYTMQVVLNCARSTNRATAYLLARFHLDVHFWRDLCEDMDTCPTYLVEIIHRDASDLGYCDASDVGAVGVWIEPNEYVINRV